MGFWEAVKRCFRKYVDFNGRASRAEFWWWTLFVLLVSVVLFTFTAILAEYGNLETASLGVFNVWLIFIVAVFLPGLAVGVRRLHDLDMSGWWYLIVLVPTIGPIALLILFCLRGTRGQNRLGRDPLGNDLVDTF